MRTWSVILSPALALSLGTAGQTTASSSPSSASPVIIAEAPKAPDINNANTVAVPVIGVGTGVVAELSKTINAKKAKPGDRVKAQVIQDVLYRGKIVISRGSKLVGHVVMAKARTKEDRESRLGIVFDKAELKGGGEINLLACIRALAAPSSMSMVDRPEMMAPPPMPGASGQGQQGAQPIGTPRNGVGSSNPGTRGITPRPSQANTAGSAAASYSQMPVSGIDQKGNDHLLLSSVSRGVFGLYGVSLLAAGTGASQSTIITSLRDDVKLESGIQIVVQLNVPATK